MEDMKETLDIYNRIKLDLENGVTVNELHHKYTDFATRKPKTFFNIIYNTFDVNTFKELMGVYNDHKESGQTKATIEVGEIIAKRFLYPKIGEPTKERYDEELAKLSSK